MMFHQVTAVALFVVLHVIIITSNGKVNNKQQAATKRLMQKAENKWKKKKDGRWTKFSYQNRNRNKPAGSKSTLESMMSSSAVVAAVRSVGSTSILASQAATEATASRATWQGRTGREAKNSNQLTLKRLQDKAEHDGNLYTKRRTNPRKIGIQMRENQVYSGDWIWLNKRQVFYKNRYAPSFM